VRAWAHGVPSAPPNPRRLGRIEVCFSAAAAVLNLFGMWLA
jgi:hypothetical protein